MKLTRTAVAVATAGSLLVTGPLALAASTSGSTPKNGKINIYVSNLTETKGKITVTGVIGDYGTILTTNKAGKVDANGAYQHANLKHGTFLVDSTGLNKAFGKSRPVVNPDNCSVTFDATGPSTIISGTGDYAGISGNVQITATFAGIAAKTKAGKCNLADNAPTYGMYTAITGSGSVSFK